jgi:hypothetical protein
VATNYISNNVWHQVSLFGGAENSLSSFFQHRLPEIVCGHRAIIAKLGVIEPPRVCCGRVLLPRQLSRGLLGRPRCFPHVSVAVTPAVTRSLMSDDSSLAMAPIDGEHGPAHRAVGVDLIPDADEAHA